jgi:hypothetical protein
VLQPDPDRRVVYVRRPDALNRAATAGPELVVEDAR